MDQCLCGSIVAGFTVTITSESSLYNKNKYGWLTEKQAQFIHFIQNHKVNTERIFYRRDFVTNKDFIFWKPKCWKKFIGTLNNQFGLHRVELENSRWFMSAKFIHSIKNSRMNWMRTSNTRHLLDSEFESQLFDIFSVLMHDNLKWNEISICVNICI